MCIDQEKLDLEPLKRQLISVRYFNLTNEDYPPQNIEDGIQTLGWITIRGDEHIVEACVSFPKDKPHSHIHLKPAKFVGPRGIPGCSVAFQDYHESGMLALRIVRDQIREKYKFPDVCYAGDEFFDGELSVEGIDQLQRATREYYRIAHSKRFRKIVEGLDARIRPELTDLLSKLK